MPERIKRLMSIPTDLFSRREPRLVSIYLQTHRNLPENDQDRIRFKNLVAEVEKQLQAIEAKRDHAKLIENLEAVLEDPDRQIWRFVEEGLAVFVDEDTAYVYALGYPVEDITVVSDRFYVKPLVRDLQYGCRCNLLALSKDRFEVYTVSDSTLTKLEMPEGVFNRLEDVFSELDDDSGVIGGSLNGKDPRFYRHDSKNAVEDRETTRFFRYVNDAFVENFSSISDYPVILVTLPEYQVEFRALTTIPGLVEQGIDKTPISLQETDLKSEACSIMRELRDSSIEKVLDMYGFNKSRGLAASDPSEIAHALVQRSVAVLFVEDGMAIAGSMDEDTGAILEETTGPWDRDLVDQFVRLTFAGGGAVYSVGNDLMPSDTGVAAILRGYIPTAESV